MSALVVFGANGALGREVAAAALRRKHQVTAVARRMPGLPEHPELSVRLLGVADDPEGVTDVVTGHDAVILAVGNPLRLKGKRGPAIMASATRNVVAAMRTNGVGRLVLPLAWGSGASRSQTSVLVRLLTRTLIRRDYADFDAAEHLATTGGISCAVTYFGSLTDGPQTGRWHADPTLATPTPLAISRADLAEHLVEAATAPNAQRVAISGAPRVERA